MSTYSQSYATQVVADDAAFRVRGKWFSDRLTDIGWAKTADTGQINWATVAKPAGATTAAGYEIRKSNDGKTDIYVKIEYGTGAAATYFAFWFTFGEGSDGAGAITGDKTTRTALSGNASGAVGCTDYMCGDTSRFWLLCACNTSVGALATTLPGGGVQRTTDASGVDTSEGFITFAVGNSASKNEFVSFSAGTGGQRSGLGGMLYCTAPFPGSAGEIPVFPFYVFSPSRYLLARDLVAVPTAYATVSSTHTFALLGSNRTFIALWGGSVSYLSDGGNAVGNLTLCLRWE
jgi:hypothetical protein